MTTPPPGPRPVPAPAPARPGPVPTAPVPIPAAPSPRPAALTPTSEPPVVLPAHAAAESQPDLVPDPASALAPDSEPPVTPQNDTLSAKASPFPEGTAPPPEPKPARFGLKVPRPSRKVPPGPEEDQGPAPARQAPKLPFAGRGTKAVATTVTATVDPHLVTDAAAPEAGETSGTPPAPRARAQRLPLLALGGAGVIGLALLARSLLAAPDSTAFTDPLAPLPGTSAPGALGTSQPPTVDGSAARAASTPARAAQGTPETPVPTFVQATGETGKPSPEKKTVVDTAARTPQEAVDAALVPPDPALSAAFGTPTSQAQGQGGGASVVNAATVPTRGGAGNPVAGGITRSPASSTSMNGVALAPRTATTSLPAPPPAPLTSAPPRYVPPAPLPQATVVPATPAPLPAAAPIVWLPPVSGAIQVTPAPPARAPVPVTVLVPPAAQPASAPLPPSSTGVAVPGDTSPAPSGTTPAPPAPAAEDAPAEPDVTYLGFAQTDEGRIAAVRLGAREETLAVGQVIPGTTVKVLEVTPSRLKLDTDGGTRTVPLKETK